MMLLRKCCLANEEFNEGTTVLLPDRRGGRGRSQSQSRGVELTLPSQLSCMGETGPKIRYAERLSLCREGMVLLDGDPAKDTALIPYAHAHTPTLPIPEPV